MRSSISLIFVAAAATSLTLVSANPEPTQMAGMVRRHRHHEIAQRGVVEELNESHLEKRQTYHGSATYYNVQTGNAGACGSYLSSSDYVVALAQPLWGNLNVKSPLCGHTITISANGKSTQATIMDACPTGGGNCGGPDLDMSQSLFEFFNPIGVGKFGITWSLGGGGGGSSHGSSGGSGSGSDDNDDEDDAASSKAAAAAASKSREAASRSSVAASKSSVSAASASRSSASVASVASKSSASHYSVTKAAAQSSASVASVASSKSKASKVAAAKASKAAAKEWAADQKKAKNVENFGKIVDGMSKMVQAAHN